MPEWLQNVIGVGIIAGALGVSYLIYKSHSSEKFRPYGNKWELRYLDYGMFKPDSVYYPSDSTVYYYLDLDKDASPDVKIMLGQNKPNISGSIPQVVIKKNYEKLFGIHIVDTSNVLWKN